MKGLPKTIWLESITAHKKNVTDKVMKVSYKNIREQSKRSYDILMQGKATNPQSVDILLSALNDIKGFKKSHVEKMDRRNLLWQFQIASTLN